ncbi:MAG: hypothetical protein U0X76_04755 [Bacteroidia bacterium]
MNNSFLNSIELISLLNRWKKQLMIVAGISLLASIIFFIADVRLNEVQINGYCLSFQPYCLPTESATEQMLQICQSSTIRDQIIRSFNLFLWSRH